MKVLKYPFSLFSPLWCLHFVNTYAQAVLKFLKLDTRAQQREAVVQGRSLPLIPASV
ncbi:MAG: hypothetical protein LBJ00_11240 [Planctomycetaceae bacterium]|nr:hypothetical protein [Planctomycetaceae bacterium]